MIGDLNMDLLSNKGDKLISLMNNFNFVSYQNKPTHFNKSSNTCLDIIFSNAHDIVNSSDNIHCPYSDHSFVVLILDTKPSKFSPAIIDSRAITADKLEKINDELLQVPFSTLDGVDDVDDKFFLFKKLILDVIDSVAPVKSIRIKQNNLPWVDNEMKKHFLERDRLHALACSFDKSHTIWDTFRKLRNSCKSLLRKKNERFF